MTLERFEYSRCLADTRIRISLSVESEVIGRGSYLLPRSVPIPFCMRRRRRARGRQMAEVNPTTTNAESYFAYEGSFTAPPCAEGVAWRVLKNPLPIAPAHLAAFQRVQGKNNRPTQPLNGREVLDSSPAPSQL